MTEFRALVTGKVQGVAYRAYVQDAATELEVKGFVRNLADGSVEVVAQALPDTLKDFVEYLYEGSLKASIDTVALEWRSVKRVYDDFSIRQ